MIKVTKLEIINQNKDNERSLSIYDIVIISLVSVITTLLCVAVAVVVVYRTNKKRYDKSGEAKLTKTYFVIVFHF